MLYKKVSKQVKYRRCRKKTKCLSPITKHRRLCQSITENPARVRRSYLQHENLASTECICYYDPDFKGNQNCKHLTNVYWTWPNWPELINLTYASCKWPDRPDPSWLIVTGLWKHLRSVGVLHFFLLYLRIAALFTVMTLAALFWITFFVTDQPEQILYSIFLYFWHNSSILFHTLIFLSFMSDKFVFPDIFTYKVVLLYPAYHPKAAGPMKWVNELYVYLSVTQ